MYDVSASQTTASWLGFASTVGCVIGGVACGRLADVVPRVKGILLLLYLASTLLFIWFSLLANGTITPSTWQLFVSCTLGGYVDA